MRSFSLFETDIQRFGCTGFLLVILDRSNDCSWFALSSGLMREIADKIEHFAHRISSGATHRERERREAEFLADTLRLSKLDLPLDASSFDAILTWKLGIVPDAFVLEFVLQEGTRRYILDIVSAANLTVQIRDALDPAIRREGGTTN